MGSKDLEFESSFYPNCFLPLGESFIISFVFEAKIALLEFSALRGSQHP